MTARGWLPGFLSLAALVFSARARADEPGPWLAGLAGLPAEAQSALIVRQDEPVFTAPRPDAPRRGTVVAGALLPLFASTRGPGCPTAWLMLGPMAWLCRSHIELTTASPLRASDVPADAADGLPFRYFFVGRGGSAAYRRFEFADMAEPDQELQPGFAITVVEERARGRDVYGHTHRERWVPMRDLIPVRPFLFKGEELPDGKLNVAWVNAERAPIASKPGGPPGRDVAVRFERIEVQAIEKRGATEYVQAGPDRWLRASDVRRPHLVPPPGEVRPGERWVDVELASQTLVLYEGEKPVFATLVSTGKGAQGTATATPRGVHRIWVKLRSSTMDNLDDDNASSSYAIEDVPYVQFFHKGVALHGAFWHHDFGRIHSHGCVNLAPIDAQRVFHFTGPRLPAGWSATFPNEFEAGTVVQVR